MSARKESKIAALPTASRPYMPGYGLPTDEKGLLPWKWAADHLAKSHSYWIATVRPEGRPHAMPVWGIWVDSVFYFSTGRDSRKSKNLTANPHCVVCTADPEDGVIVEGVAEEVTDPARIKKLGVPYHKKYKPWKLDPKLGPVYAVRPRVAFGMWEKKFAEAATRWRFEGSES
jgi:general stress protein 26